MRKFIYIISFLYLLSICLYTPPALANQKNKLIYCAGSLSKVSDLVFNKMLSDNIYKLSNGKYKCLLPQEEVANHKNFKRAMKKESPDVKRNAIKNIDVDLINKADAIIVNMDGKASSVGSVVEFVIAKCLHKPSILYKTDANHDSFQNQSNHSPRSGPWSVMLNYYPNSKVILLETGKIFREYKEKDKTDMLASHLITKLSHEIIHSLDKLSYKNNINTKQKQYCLESFVSRIEEEPDKIE